jgi:hypothetical protein
VKQYLNDKYIRRQITVVYSSQTNGPVEMSNYPIVNKVRVVLFSRGLPKSLWAEINSCVIGIHNHMATKPFNNKWLFEMVFKRLHKPNILLNTK